MERGKRGEERERGGKEGVPEYRKIQIVVVVRLAFVVVSGTLPLLFLLSFAVLASPPFVGTLLPFLCFLSLSQLHNVLKKDKEERGRGKRREGKGEEDMKGL